MLFKQLEINLKHACLDYIKKHLRTTAEVKTSTQKSSRAIKFSRLPCLFCCIKINGKNKRNNQINLQGTVHK